MERARLRNSDLKGFSQFTKLNIIISVFQYFLFRVQVHKTFQSHIQYFWHIVAALVVLYRHNCKKIKDAFVCTVTCILYYCTVSSVAPRVPLADELQNQ